jgi:hypothetical protein
MAPNGSQGKLRRNCQKLLPWTKQIGTGFSHSLCPLMQLVQKVSSMLSQLESNWHRFESGEKLNQVQLLFSWQLSRHWNSSTEGRMSKPWLLVHSPEMKHWSSLQFPEFGIQMKWKTLKEVQILYLICKRQFV